MTRPLLSGLLLMLAACSVTGPSAPAPDEFANVVSWPSSPDAARIRYLQSFRSPADIDYRLPFSSRLQGILAGESDHQMVRPYAIDVDEQFMAIADPGAGLVHVYDRQKQSYGYIQSVGDAGLRSPVGVALGNSLIFIVDSVLGKVFGLDSNGRVALEIDGLVRPTSLAFDHFKNRILVADTHGHRITGYNMQGAQVLSIGERGDGEGHFNYPSHIAVAHERIYVNDTLNFRIQVFDLQGRFVQALGEHGDTPGYFAQPKGLAVNSEGHVFVAETINNRIQVFDLQGDYLVGFGHTGEDAGGFSMPAGLVIHDDRIYVVDSGNRRVQVFEYLGER